MQDKQKITLYLPPELHRQLKIKSAMELEPMSVIAEKALSEVFESNLDTPPVETTSETKHKVTLYVSPELHRRLKIRAAEPESMADIAERAISFYLSHPEAFDEIGTLRPETKPQEGLESHKRLALNIDLRDAAPTDEVILEVVELCKALNAYHIACGGSGLDIDDWELLVRARQLVEV
jgi:hypothetical protein